MDHRGVRVVIGKFNPKSVAWLAWQLPGVGLGENGDVRKWKESLEHFCETFDKDLVCFKNLCLYSHLKEERLEMNFRNDPYSITPTLGLVNSCKISYFSVLIFLSSNKNWCQQ